MSCLLVLVILFSISLFLPGCGFQHGSFPICKQFQDLPLTEVTSPDPKLVFEEDTKIKVMHGFGTAKLNSGNYMKVEQNVPVPAYVNQATVFLNGWRLNYLGSNQHVLGLGALITNIKFDRRSSKLTWNAVGVLRDDDAKEAYSLTYYYAVIAWNDTAVSLTVDQGNPDDLCNDNYFWTDNTGTTTALSSFSSFIEKPDFPSGRPVAVLPRGFGFAWTGGDHHLLQMAYNLDHGEIFAENKKRYKKRDGEIPAPLPAPPASRVDSGFVSWDTYSIFKDDSGRRGYAFGEMVSALGGNDVGVLQPPFSILPIKGEGGGALGGGVQTKEYVIENIPFQYAIPLLTGWELGYLTDDQHVKDVGVWIGDWSYELGVGKLHYTLSSILADNDKLPGHYDRHKVTVLGIRPVAGVVR